MIKSPEFIRSHLKISSKPGNTAQRKLISSSSFDFFNSYLTECHLDSALYSVCSIRDSGYQNSASSHGEPVEIVGSSNGLICVITRFIAGEDRCLYLWNPSIRKFSRLPHWGFDFKRSDLGTYGFGYVELQDDHKFVALVCDSSWGIKHPKDQVLKVYSRRSNSWKRIEGSKNHLYLNDWRVTHGGAFVNGKIHWAAKSLGNRGYRHLLANKIVSFDLADETYEDIELPENYTAWTGSRKWSIGVLGEGHLALLWYHVEETLDVNLWIMTEYGVGQSWTKMFVIRYPEDVLKGQFSRSAVRAMQPVFSSIKGELLLKLGSRLILYNPEDDSYQDRTISYNLPHVDNDLKVDIYDESLVLLDAHDQIS